MPHCLIIQVCRYDYVKVKDKNDQVLGTFCGGKIPQTVTSSSNLMWVEFRSDHTQSRAGFSAVYYAGNRGRMKISIRTLYALEQSRGSCSNLLGGFAWERSESLIFHSARKIALKFVLLYVLQLFLFVMDMTRRI